MQKIPKTHHCPLPLYHIIGGNPLGTNSISTIVKAKHTKKKKKKRHRKTLRQCEHIPRYQKKSILFIKLIIPAMPIHSKTATNLTDVNAVQLTIASHRAQYPANVSQNNLRLCSHNTTPLPILPPSKRTQEKENIRGKEHWPFLSKLSAAWCHYPKLSFQMLSHTFQRDKEDETYFVETVPTLVMQLALQKATRRGRSKKHHPSEACQ